MYHVIPEDDKVAPEGMDEQSETASMSSFDMCDLDEGHSEPSTPAGEPPKNDSKSFNTAFGEHQLEETRCATAAHDSAGTTAEADTARGIAIGSQGGNDSRSKLEMETLWQEDSPAGRTGVTKQGGAFASADAASEDVASSRQGLFVRVSVNSDNVAKETAVSLLPVEGIPANQYEDARFSQEPETAPLAIDADNESNFRNPHDLGVTMLATAADDEAVEVIDLLPTDASVSEGKDEQHAARSAREEKQLAEDLIRLARAVSQREGVRQAVRQEVEASTDLRNSLQSLFGSSLHSQELPKAALQAPSHEAAAPSGRLKEPLISSDCAALVESLGTSQTFPVESGQHTAQAEPPLAASSALDGSSQQPPPARDDTQELADTASLSSAYHAQSPLHVVAGDFVDTQDAASETGALLPENEEFPRQAGGHRERSQPHDAVSEDVAARENGPENGPDDEHRHAADDGDRQQPYGSHRCEDIPPIVRKVNQGLRAAWRGARNAVRRAREHFDGLNDNWGACGDRGGFEGPLRGGAGGHQQCVDATNVILTTAVVAAAGLLVHSAMSSSSRSRRE